MTTVNRAFGDLYIKSLNGNVYIDAQSGNGVTTIHGNLLVIGKQTNIGSIETIISDNIITLAANVTSGTPVLDAGLEVRRGDEPNSALQWIETFKRWRVFDGSHWANVMIRVEDDPDPHLGGPLNVNNFPIYSHPDKNIVLWPGKQNDESTAGIEIKYSNKKMNIAANAVVLSSMVPSNGKTGLYVTNTVSDNEELITKRKSVVYSLVL
jgi:hypothetical protein